MDKQKQIEEMAKVVCECCIENEEFTCEFVSQPCVFAKTFAETSYNKGYRKIPEGSVVLTKQEYEKLDLVKEMYGCEDKVKVSDILNMLKYTDKTARKETAEKFAKRLKAHLKQSYHNLYHADYREGMVSINLGTLIENIDEICKEITEGGCNG